MHVVDVGDVATIEGVEISTNVEGLAAGVVVARGCAVGPAPEALTAEIAEAIRAAVEDDAIKGAVRDLLRFGKYKPTGRGKPASEYLAKAAREDRFPAINNLVDVNNLVSLRTQLPISLIDVDRAGSEQLLIRRGRTGESYVFNTSGQEIGLEDLLLVASMPDDTPRANPVKDSMSSKLNDDSKNVVAVLYAPASLREGLEAATASFAALLTEYSGAGQVGHAVL